MLFRTYPTKDIVQNVFNLNRRKRNKSPRTRGSLRTSIWRCYILDHVRHRIFNSDPKQNSVNQSINRSSTLFSNSTSPCWRRSLKAAQSLRTRAGCHADEPSCPGWRHTRQRHQGRKDDWCNGRGNLPLTENQARAIRRNSSKDPRGANGNENYPSVF